MPADPGPALSLRSRPVERGKLIRLERDAQTNPTLEFQYNPETVTRSRTGRWEPRKRRRAPDAVETPQQRRGDLGGAGASALLSEAETIAFRLTFDATEAILRAGSLPATAATPAGDLGADRGMHPAEIGVLDQLAFLEMVSLGREERERQRGPGRPTPGQEIRPIRPDQLLLALGGARWFPCVITELTITEQRFTPQLVPVRAEVDLKLTVLEPVENAYNPLVRPAFDRLLRQRDERVDRLGTTTPTQALQDLLEGPRP